MNALLMDVLPVVGIGSLAANALLGTSVRRLTGRLAAARAALTSADAEAITDPLTGLANRAGLRRAFTEFADESVDLVMVDLDDFKPVNDLYGHDAGDALLVEVAARLAGIVADVDGAVVARLGGDEFVLACPSPESLVEMLGADVITVLAAPVDLDGVQIRVRASVGAVHVTAGDDPNKALKAADAAVYEVKARGGDGMVEHHPLSPLPEIECRPLVRMREWAALVRLLGSPAGEAR